MLRIWSLGVFVLTLAWAAASALTTPPLGPDEEHSKIGRRLYNTGSLAADDDPGVLRPPGFPAFVAGVYHVRDALAGVPRGGSTPADDISALILAQCLLLASASGALFVFAASRLAPIEAACVAIAFGCGPLSLPLLGLFSYPLLHMVGITLGTVLLVSAASREPQQVKSTLVAGMAFGLTTLVRPVSLILPPFVLLLARFRRNGTWRSAGVFALLFSAGMAGAILPYTARNYAVTGRIVPVNAQGGFALWASTLEGVGSEHDYLDWITLWRKHGIGMYRELTGESDYSLGPFSQHVLALDRAFARRAWQNIRRQPLVYLGNVSQNLWRFALDPLTYWPRRLAAQNGTPAAVVSTGLFTHGLALFGLPGLVLGLRRREPAAAVVFSVFASLAIAHALTFLNGRYTYAKLPLLLMAAVLTLGGLGSRTLAPARPGIRVRWATALAFILVLWSVMATPWP